MKQFIPSLLLGLLSCSDAPKPKIETHNTNDESLEIVRSDFQSLLDSAEVKGSMLIWDEKKYYSNDFEWAKKGHLPASTFKIPNSIIALELGIIDNDSTIIKWDGKPQFQKRWEKDLTFKEAFHLSCVPCYQEIARSIGLKRMKNYLSNLNYGNMEVDSTNLDLFWLEGQSNINQYQQIGFLRKFNKQKLPISKRTHAIMSRMMIIEETEQYTLRGKTGWSIVDNQDNCWYVGFLETRYGFFYFATNIEPTEPTDLNNLPSIRKTLTEEALRAIGAYN